MSAPPLLELREVDCVYGAVSAVPFRRRQVEPTVRNVSCRLEPGQTLALVGESGSGKTTIARAVAGLLKPAKGEILFEGRTLAGSVGQRPRELRREVQLVFQNPDSSLNPKQRIGAILGRPLDHFFGLSARERRRRAEQLLDDVHLPAGYLRRLPAQLSGGERQRVAIARALAAEPKLVLCDEVVSALDVSVQAAILDLLRELQQRKAIAYLFIAHDLAVVRWLAHRVIVLYRGRVMEQGTAEETFSPPFHPYTEALLKCVPEPDPTRPLLKAPESALGRADGERKTACPYAPVCARKLGQVCENEPPPWRSASTSHGLLCHIPLDELAKVSPPPALATRGRS
jgi:peptide/nickel transport system ATP-binding protein